MNENGTMAKLVIACVALVIFVVFALCLFLHWEIDRHQEKAARVFDLAKEYRVSLRATNTQFSQRWSEYYDDSVDPYNGGNLDQQAYTDLVMKFLATDANHDSYEALAGFYDSIGECVRARLCDFWLTRSMFGNDIVTFYHNMYPALDAESRQGQSDAGIVDFVAWMQQADHGQSHPGWEDRMVQWAY